MTKTAEANPVTDVVPVLWMDNDPKNITLIKKFIDEERKHFQIHVEIVPTIEAARAALNTGNYGAVIADCKMDDFDLSVSGAEFLSEVAEENPALPRFVYSSYLEDPRYEPLIEQSAVVARASKVDDRFVPPLASHDFFKKLNNSAARFYRVRNLAPERIEFGAYLQEPERFMKDVTGHWEKHGAWISAAMEKQGWVWCVVVGTRIVDGSEDLDGFPSENDLTELGHKYNLIPFAYGGVAPPEETPSGAPRSSWSATKKSNDWYPTIRVQVNGEELDGDFDTGAYCSYISEGLVRRGLLNFARGSTHLGRPFRYFMKTLRLGVADIAGVSSSRDVTLAVVEDWAGTSFTEINPARTCLFGRDLLRAFNLAVVLDSERRATILRHIASPRAACPLDGSSAGRDMCLIKV